MEVVTDNEFNTMAEHASQNCKPIVTDE